MPISFGAADIDGMLHGDGNAGWRPFDFMGFGCALIAEGINRGVACSNRPLSQIADQLWASTSFQTKVVGQNVDKYLIDQVFAATRKFNVERVVLLGNDHCYADMLRTLRRKSIITEVWARRACVSFDLVKASDKVSWLDGWMLPMPKKSNPIHHGASMQRLKAA